jgi:hypothetical protein
MPSAWLPSASLPPPSILTASGTDPPPPPVQCCIGAKIAHTAAPHRLKSGAITNFDCRYTITHHQDHRHTSSHAAAVIPTRPAAIHRPGSNSPPSPRRLTSPPQLFSFFSARKNEKAV